MMRHILAALVVNEPGVLAHVAGMFAARGFNIDSLVVGRTDKPDVSRMTIVANGDDQVVDQIRKQLGKLVEVIKVVHYGESDHVERDLMLVRVTANGETRRDVIELAGLFRARVVDVGHQEIMVEMSGPEAKLEAFIDLISPFGIVELARTGVIAMPRSEKVPGQIPRSEIRRAPRGKATDANADDDDQSNLPPG